MRHEILPKRANGVAWRTVGGEAVLVVQSRGTAHALNAAGAACWALMDGGAGLGEIAARVASEYGLPEAEALKDLERFAEELRAVGALEEGSGEPAEGPVPSGSEEAGEKAGSDEGTAGPASMMSTREARYERPSVTCTEPLEVLAAFCDSARATSIGPPKPGLCRMFGACQKPFE